MKKVLFCLATLPATVALTACSSSSTPAGASTDDAGDLRADAAAGGDDGGGMTGPREGGAQPGDDVDAFATGDDANTPSIFDDPGIPACPHAFGAAILVQGTLGNQSVSVDYEFPSSTLNATEYTALEVVDASLVNLLDLSWRTHVGQFQSAPIESGYMLVPAGQPMGNQYVCFLTGDFGIEPLDDAGAMGRLYRFRVSAGAPGQTCFQSSLQMNLKGCIYRTNTDLP